MSSRDDIQSTARAHILSADMVGSAAIAALLLDSHVPQTLQQLRDDGLLLGLQVGNEYLYPVFQCDVAAGHVRPHVAQVNQLLDAANDPWGVASWWLTENRRLPAGTTPADLAVSANPDDNRRVLILAAALTAD